MNRFHIVSFCGALALASAAANAQMVKFVRGTITSFDGKVLSIKSREGQELQLQLVENAPVAVAKAIKFEDIKQGDFIGSTTVKRADGALVAVEIHYLPPTAPQGHMNWDLQPGSMMTNGNADAIVEQAGKHELTVKYKDGMQKILVPEGTPLVRAVPGNQSDLRAGEYVFVSAQTQPDGKMTALRVQVSKDGVKPPQ
jgi:autotransporter translocation and assembly factor TamB